VSAGGVASLVSRATHKDLTWEAVTGLADDQLDEALSGPKLPLSAARSLRTKKEPDGACARRRARIIPGSDRGSASDLAERSPATPSRMETRHEGAFPAERGSGAEVAAYKERARRSVCSTSGSNYPRQRPTLPQSRLCSTIGGSRLNFRVRNGNGCGPAPMTTGKVVERPRGSSPSFNDIRVQSAGRFKVVKEQLASPKPPKVAKAGQLNTLQTVVSAPAVAPFGAMAGPPKLRERRRTRAGLIIIMVKPHG
jgi:hypothetical protein